jgi:hypothetical protein
MRFLLLAAFLSACGGREVVIVERTRYCLNLAPPVAEPFQAGVRSEGEDGCAHAVCLTKDGAAALTRYLYRVRDWAAEAWILCHAPDGGLS